jgi:hypothetical protein
MPESSRLALARSIPLAAPPATVAMQLRDARLALRARMVIAERETVETWERKGPGRCLSLREVVRDLLGFLETHERRLGEVTTKLERAEHTP